MKIKDSAKFRPILCEGTNNWNEIPETSTTMDGDQFNGRNLFELVSSIRAGEYLEVPEVSKTVHEPFGDTYVLEIPRIPPTLIDEKVDEESRNASIELEGIHYDIIDITDDEPLKNVTLAAGGETGEHESNHSSDSATDYSLETTERGRTPISSQIQYQHIYEQRQQALSQKKEGGVLNPINPQVPPKEENFSVSWEATSPNSKREKSKNRDESRRQIYRMLPPSNSRQDIQKEVSEQEDGMCTYRPAVKPVTISEAVPCVIVGQDEESFVFVSHSQKVSAPASNRPSPQKLSHHANPNSITASVAAAVAASVITPRYPFAANNRAHQVSREISQLDGEAMLFADVTDNNFKNKSVISNNFFTQESESPKSNNDNISIKKAELREDIQVCSWPFYFVFRFMCVINLACLGVSLGLELHMNRNDRSLGFAMISFSVLCNCVFFLISSLEVSRIWVTVTAVSVCIDFLLAVALYFYRIVTAIQAGFYIGILCYFVAYTVAVRFPCSSLVIYYRAALSLREASSTIEVKKKIVFTQGMLSVLQDL